MFERSGTMRFIVDSEKVNGELTFNSISISPNERYGYRPYELFISSIVGCSGSLLRNILKKQRYTFDLIEMEVTTERNPLYANRIEKLSIISKIKCNGLIETKHAEKLANLVIKNCGMIQSINQSIEISFAIQSVEWNGI